MVSVTKEPLVVAPRGYQGTVERKRAYRGAERIYERSDPRRDIPKHNCKTFLSRPAVTNKEAVLSPPLYLISVPSLQNFSKRKNDYDAK